MRSKGAFLVLEKAILITLNVTSSKRPQNSKFVQVGLGIKEHQNTQ